MRLCAGQPGLTLLEVVVATLVLAVLVLALAPQLSSTDPYRVDVVAEEVAAALRFGRSEAMRTGEPRGVRIQAPPGEVTVYQPNLVGGMTALGSVVLHPVTKQPFRFRIDAVRVAPGVAMLNTKAPFKYAGLGTDVSDVLFDADGMPRLLAVGTWRRLTTGEVRLGFGSHVRRVMLSPLGRVEVQ